MAVISLVVAGTVTWSSQCTVLLHLLSKHNTKLPSGTNKNFQKENVFSLLTLPLFVITGHKLVLAVYFLRAS